MLDVIASAMGAFLIIMVVIIPYFNKDSQKLMEENRVLNKQIQQQQARIEAQQRKIHNQRQEVNRLQARAARQRKQVAAMQREVQSLRDKLKRTFLIVMVSWKTGRHDVDLHVVDPAGREFYYNKESYPGAPGMLSEDDKLGPGREVWVITQAPPGNYKVYYNLYDFRGNRRAAVVTGMVYHRDGFNPLPKTVLNREKHKVLVGTITVHGDGSVTIH
ncbi:MAG: hypothetical protein K9K66_00205 [Desulfarculaceae bacterium]|nr:hypothetical protein [Desulfarculaceae bacterium]MCF8072133.1 hypothetical protein [Desulfarculaceae bacterium]MCF8100054.1 hypothetical protein [Desulfarculaceae bacterium]MCF8118261.1 hypothetical protein [Desulfarculaceae bacterium]